MLIQYLLFTEHSIMGYADTKISNTISTLKGVIRRCMLGGRWRLLGNSLKEKTKRFPDGAVSLQFGETSLLSCPYSLVCLFARRNAPLPFPCQYLLTCLPRPISNASWSMNSALIPSSKYAFDTSEPPSYPLLRSVTCVEALWGGGYVPYRQKMYFSQS